VITVEKAIHEAGIETENRPLAKFDKIVDAFSEPEIKLSDFHIETDIPF
jgi:hypothetical protein